LLTFVDILSFEKPKQHALTQSITDLIMHKYHRAPRSLQQEIGPSEIGEDCLRKLAYNIMREPKLNDGGDPLPSIIGTASHLWMEDACNQWNAHIGRTRYIAEAAFPIVPGMPGHCDCYDVDTATVIDWKFPGVTKMTAYKKGGPSLQYRSQAHLYGKGWSQLGAPVKDVAIVFFPRGGMLSGMHIWSEPFDVAIADAALARYYGTTELALALDVEHFPENYMRIPATKGHACTYCNWFKPGDDTGTGCPGWTVK
jgi:hypothetical protein